MVSLIMKQQGLFDRLREKSPAEWRESLDRQAARTVRTRTLKMRNRRPVASITFDDCPQTAVMAGADILEKRGVRGTFFVCGSLVGRDWENGRQYDRDDLVKLADRGHEIGCHTYGHQRCPAIGRRALEQDLAANQSFIGETLGDYVLTSFAYPYGAFGLASKRVLQSRFTVCRGIEPGIEAGTVDLGLVKSNLIPHDTDSADWLKPLIEETVTRNGWLTLFTHDVAGHPTPFGCRPAALAAAVDALTAAGIEVLPVKNALGRIAFDGT